MVSVVGFGKGVDCSASYAQPRYTHMFVKVRKRRGAPFEERPINVLRAHSFPRCTLSFHVLRGIYRSAAQLIFHFRDELWMHREHVFPLLWEDCC